MSQGLSSGGFPQVFGGTATTTPADAKPEDNSDGSSVTIVNVDATNNLLVAFSDAPGAQYFPILPRTQLSFPFGGKKLKVKSSAATVVYAVLWTTLA